MNDKMPPFHQVISEGENGYSTNILGFCPGNEGSVLFDKLADVVATQNAQNRNVKFRNNTPVRIVATEAEIIRLLTEGGTYNYREAQMEAMYMKCYGGVIFGTQVLKGKRYYDVDINGHWMPLPEEFLEPINIPSREQNVIEYDDR